MSGLIEAHQLSFTYPLDGRGLQPVSFSVEAGEAVLVAGHSGCGKSTLARCLCGLIPHLYHGQFTGQVLVGGQPTANIQMWELAEQVGMVFQNPSAQMLAPTVEDEILFGLENLGLPRLEVGRRLEEALQRFALDDMRGRAPQTLSGGEQQKLALAAITARHPQALVLDEPLSMLDITSALEFVAHTRDLLAEGTAAIFCEHRQEYLSSLPGLKTVPLRAAESAPPAPPLISSWPGIEHHPHELQVRGLSVARGGKPILHDLDLDLAGGKTIALVGRNGVGKTTLFRALAGLQKYSGSITVQGVNGPEKPQLGMIFQNPDLQLFNASVRAEILYRIQAPDPDLYAWLLHALGLERYEDTPPLLLSEGEKRRLALATTLMRRPRHGLLLDEPALGQDDAHKATLMNILRAYAAAGHLVIFSTHDLELASQADMLILLGPEGIAAQGRTAEVMQMEPIWRRLGFVLPGWMRAGCFA